MSTLFSIDDDELDIDFDDEEFLLAACGISTSSSTRGTATSSTFTTSCNPARNPLQNCNAFATSSDIIQQESSKIINETGCSRKPLGSLGNGMGPKQDVTLTSRGKQFASDSAGPPRKKQTTDISSRTSIPSGTTIPGDNSPVQCPSRNYRNIPVPLEQGNLQRPAYLPVDVVSESQINSNVRTSTGGPNPRHLQSPCNNINITTPIRRGMVSPAPSLGSSASRQSCFTTPLSKRSAFNTPSRSLNSRKFPGPAGLLPKLSPGLNLDETLANSPIVSVPFRKSPPAAQVKTSAGEDDDFSRDPWISMHKEFQENVSDIMRYTVMKVLVEAASQRLSHGKVPCLCALVKGFSPTQTDASILLKDQTGEIHGTLHRKVLEEYQTEVWLGAGLILKQVSVFSPTPRKHYLNITPGNIIAFYPPDPSYVTNSQPLASQMTQAEKQKKESIVINDDDGCSTQELFPETETQPRTSSNETNNRPADTQENFAELLEGLEEDDIFDEALLAL